MKSNLIYLLDDDQGIISDAIRGFFASIIRFIYNWIGSLTDAMYRFANNDYLGLGNYAEEFAVKIFNILIIFMIFKLTLTFLNYLVNPDAFADSNKGIQNVIKRIIISFVLLVSINPIFDTLFDIQQNIIDEDVVENLMLGSDSDKIYVTSEGLKIYLTQISSYCDEYESTKRIITFSKGDHLALLTLKPFVQPVNEDVGDFPERQKKLKDAGYCGTDVDSLDGLAYVDTSAFAMSQSFDGIKSASGLLKWSIYNGATGKGIKNGFEANYYIIDFNYFIALIVGIVVSLLLITFCFDIVIRGFTLMLLQILAPIPIISYVSPGGKSADMLPNWGKKIVSTWASLFVRIIALDFGLSIISAICESGGIGDDSMGLLMKIVIILGALMFAKKLPQLLEELFPGLKLGGMELNPFKRISKDALGGNLMLGAGAAIGGAALSGITNGVQRSIETGQNVNQAQGFRNKLRAFGSGVGRTFGSAFAGATRGGLNSFNRTRKDGNIFGGMWNGYQTAMYSKLLREENRRKGMTAGDVVLADMARWTGNLTEGQKEQILAEQQDQQIAQHEQILSQRKQFNSDRQAQLNNEKRALADDRRILAEEKHRRLEPFENYQRVATSLKSRLDYLVDEDSEVKEAKAMLERANGSGNESDIAAAQDILREAKKTAYSKHFNDPSDRMMSQLKNNLKSLRESNIELQSEEFNYIKDGGFNKDVMTNITTQTQLISEDFKARESEFTVRDRVIEGQQNAIDEYQRTEIEQYQRNNIDNVKNSKAYKDAHQKDSPAKTANAQSFNREPQKPGQMFSAGLPPQANIGQQSFYNGLGGGPGNGTPPPPPGGQS